MRLYLLLSQTSILLNAVVILSIHDDFNIVFRCRIIAAEADYRLDKKAYRNISTGSLIQRDRRP